MAEFFFSNSQEEEGGWGGLDIIRLLSSIDNDKFGKFSKSQGVP